MMNSSNMESGFVFAWSTIKDYLDRLVPVKDGFSAALKGSVTLPNGKIVFIKMGTDEATNYHTQEETMVYELLTSLNFPFVPKLIAHSPDKTKIALQALTPDTGWSWPLIWTDIHLDKALNAMDALADIPLTETQATYLRSGRILSADDGGWQALVDSDDSQRFIRKILTDRNNAILVKNLDFSELATQEASFKFIEDKLVHYDIRIYNSAWNQTRQTAYLVDLDWVALGDSRIAMALTLGDAQSTGLDVLHRYHSRLDTEALRWVAG